MGRTTKDGREFSREDQMELRRVLEYCYDTTVCRRIHILRPFDREDPVPREDTAQRKDTISQEDPVPQEDTVSRSGKIAPLLDRLRDPMQHPSNLSKCCDICDLDISPNDCFREITEEQAEGFEEALQSCSESTSLSNLSNRVAEYFASLNEARETTEFLVAVGALKLRYKAREVGEDKRLYFNLSISAVS
jgi:hypothetical protein